MEVSSLAKLMGKQVCNVILERQLEDEEHQPDTIKVMETLNCAGLLPVSYTHLFNLPFFILPALPYKYLLYLPVLT